MNKAERLIGQTLLTATKVLDVSGSSSPQLDAEVLLAFVLGVRRSYLRAYPEQTLTNDQWVAFEKLMHRRVAGEPVAYLVGEKEFWSLPFRVTPATLIPRPETEMLVAKLLELLPNDPKLPQQVAELGTGSGAIALAVASERPHWQIIATEQDPETLAIAKQNAQQLKIHTVTFLLTDPSNWCSVLPNTKFDAILSNPPYLANHDSHLQQGDVRFEPRAALVSGLDGLDAIRQIIHEAPSKLRNGGWLLLEHGYDQAVLIQDLLRAAGYNAIHSEADLAGHMRITVAQT